VIICPGPQCISVVAVVVFVVILVVVAAVVVAAVWLSLRVNLSF